MSASVLKKLNRPFNRRKSLVRSLANDFIMYEKIETTVPRAKATQSFVEKLITRAKEDSLHNKRMVEKALVLENTVRKMFDLIGPKFKERPGGYTRIIKVGNRNGDNAMIVRLEFSEPVSQVVTKPKEVKVTTESKKEKITVKKTTKEEPKKTRVTKKVKDADSK